MGLVWGTVTRIMLNLGQVWVGVEESICVGFKAALGLLMARAHAGVFVGSFGDSQNGGFPLVSL